ncbi:MAG: PIN domain nuclease [Firmicutes bacterium]|nr:PIN domain nuclease [Bacillota bacterium]MBQ4092333.1 PIN domain nuclease [Bacillota bacterium]
MLRNPRSIFYVLIVAGAMIGSYFVTEFILLQLGVAAFSPIWFVVEGIVMCFAALLFAALAPKIVEGFLWIVRDFSTRISNRSTKELISGFVGLLGGLVIAFLIGIPLNSLPFGGFISIVLIIFFGYSGLSIGLLKKDDIIEIVKTNRGVKKAPRQDKKHYLGILDTSAIIDGRFADVYRTGFLDGTFILPNFVLDELKRVADNSDPLKKERGRRGLNILNDLKSEFDDAYIMVDKDYEDVKEVDTKIIHLAVDMKTKIFTNDYNLNRMAQVQNITVLNINDLAHALKSVVLPGEELTANIIKAGKEENQGVAYLDDGTMIVVENGKQYVGLTLKLEVTSALQTSNGKMIFAKPKQ